MAKVGAEKYSETMTAFHAFNYDFVRTVDFANNNRAKGLVNLIRTESRDVMQINGLSMGETAVMRRGAVESYSVFEPFYYKGTEITTQQVPHHRIFGNYMLDQAPRANHGSFAGDNENEIVAMMEGVKSKYKGTRK
jgi:hypothetical protein